MLVPGPPRLPPGPPGLAGPRLPTGLGGMLLGLGRGPPGRGPPGRAPSAGPPAPGRPVKRGADGRGPPGVPGRAARLTRACRASEPGRPGGGWGTGLAGTGTARRRSHAGSRRAERVVAWPRSWPRAAMTRRRRRASAACCRACWRPGSRRRCGGTRPRPAGLSGRPRRGRRRRGGLRLPVRERHWRPGRLTGSARISRWPLDGRLGRRYRSGRRRQAPRAPQPAWQAQPPGQVPPGRVLPEQAPPERGSRWTLLVPRQRRGRWP